MASIREGLPALRLKRTFEGGLWITEDVIVIDARSAVRSGANAVVVVAVVDAQVQKSAVLAERGSDVPRLPPRESVALVVLTCGGLHTATVVLRFEDDVDDTRDSVRAVLRGCAVLQNLDAVDGAERDEIEVDEGQTPAAGRRRGKCWPSM